MIDVLLINKDINYIRNLINDLSNYNKNIRLSTWLINKTEVEKLLDQYYFDVILLDYSLFNECKNNFSKYKDNIILIVNEYNENIDYNYQYILKNSKIEELYLKIIKIEKNNINEQFIKKAIKDELKYLGFNPKYYGTEYLIEAIYILYKNGIDSDDNLKKVVYPIISQKYNKSIQNIRCNIINSTDMMVCECEEEKLIDYLGFFDYSKPGPKKIIEAVLNNIEKKIINK